MGIQAFEEGHGKRQIACNLPLKRTYFTAIPCSMVINTRKLWGVTKKVQLITMRTLITMTFQMVLISWVYIWPQNRPKRSLSNLS